MRLTGIIWLRDVVEKLAWKHNVTTDEVGEALKAARRFRFIETGDVEGEDLYAAMGQTAAGRHLITYFVYKTTGEAGYQCQEYDKEREEILCEKIAKSVILFLGTSRALPKQESSGIATIWLTTGI